MLARHKVYPIDAVEVELSLWCTDILHNDIAKTCAELNIPIVAYSPLGWGILAGVQIPEGDRRRYMAKFQGEALAQNMKLVTEVAKLAERKGVAQVQIALAWIHTLSGKPGMPTIIPIPGGSTSDKVTQNLTGVPRLDDAEMEEIDRILKENKIVGHRY